MRYFALEGSWAREVVALEEAESLPFLNREKNFRVVEVTESMYVHYLTEVSKFREVVPQ